MQEKESSTSDLITSSGHSGSRKKKRKPKKVKELELEKAMDVLGFAGFHTRCILVAGLLFGSDSMEIFLLTLLGVFLRATRWNIDSQQEVLLTAATLLGASVGHILFGSWCDRWGRKPINMISTTAVAVFGIGSATSPNYTVLLICRLLVGIGLGGMTVAFQTLTELLPTRFRASNLVDLRYFWSLGSIWVPLLGFLCMHGVSDESKSWRLFVLMCAFPSIVVAPLMYFFIPESPRWLLACGRNPEKNSKKALRILRDIAAMNGQEVNLLLPKGTKLLLSSSEHATAETSGPTNHQQLMDDQPPNVFTFTDIFFRVDKRTKVLVMVLMAQWFTIYFVYYGTVVVMALLFANGDATKASIRTQYEFDFAALVIIATGEMFGTALISFLVKRYQRNRIQSLSLILAAGFIYGTVSMVGYSDENASQGQQEDDAVSMLWRPRWILVLTAFLARLFLVCGSTTAWVVTTDSLPLQIRHKAQCACHAMSKLGGTLSAFFVAIDTSKKHIALSMVFMCMIASLLVVFIPETLGLEDHTYSRQQEAFVHDIEGNGSNRNEMVAEEKSFPRDAIRAESDEEYEEDDEEESEERSSDEEESGDDETSFGEGSFSIIVEEDEKGARSLKRFGEESSNSVFYDSFAEDDDYISESYREYRSSSINQSVSSRGRSNRYSGAR